MRAAFMAVMGMVLPLCLYAQTGDGVGDNLKGLQSTLDELYNQMIPMCSQLIGVGRGIAGQHVSECRSDEVHDADQRVDASGAGILRPANRQAHRHAGRR